MASRGGGGGGVKMGLRRVGGGCFINPNAFGFKYDDNSRREEGNSNRRYKLHSYQRLY